MRKKVLDKVNEKKVYSFSKVLFCLSSFVLLAFIALMYGKRVYDYYQEYHPKLVNGEKAVLLSKQIMNDHLDKELFKENNNKYYFKGKIDNNYLVYNNLLWRIVNIDEKGAVMLILEDYLNMLPWDYDNTNYNSSEINKYLHDYVYKNLDKRMLTNLNVCEDKINELESFECVNQAGNIYVGLLDISDFFNTMKDSETFIVKSDEVFWLANRSNEKVWHTYGNNVTVSYSNSIYEVKPVVKLKGTTIYYGGEGTKENPYKVTLNDDFGFGSKVKLDEDIWTVYDTRDGIRLMKDEVLKEPYRFDLSKTFYDVNNTSSLAEYLNVTYFNDLKYNNLIKKATYYDGEYNNKIYEVKDNKTEVYVAIPNILDVKFNSEVHEYFLATGSEELVFVYDNPIYSIEGNSYKNIRPCITLKDNLNFKFEDGYYIINS